MVRYFMACESKSSAFSLLTRDSRPGRGMKPKSFTHLNFMARITFHASMTMPTRLEPSTRKLALSSHRYSSRRICITMPTMMLCTETYLLSVSTSQPWKNCTSSLKARISKTMWSTEMTSVAVSSHGLVLAKRSRICSISSLSSPKTCAFISSERSMWFWKRQRAADMRPKCTSVSHVLSPVVFSFTSWSFVIQNSSTKTCGTYGLLPMIQCG
mmetsp:Transcript_28785/g.72905  ORF Transcript_28785/g.72905 Transcript_28785/m.72905 type:complete len:213 (-) Transcript_28785:621-1259(-)